MVFPITSEGLPVAAGPSTPLRTINGIFSLRWTLLIEESADVSCMYECNPR